MSEKVDVLGNLIYASASMAFASEIPGYNGSLFAISDVIKERIESDAVAARAAVAELIAAAKDLQDAMDEHDASPFDIGPSRRFIVADARHRAALANIGETK